MQFFKRHKASPFYELSFLVEATFCYNAMNMKLKLYILTKRVSDYDHTGFNITCTLSHRTNSLFL